MRDKFVQNMVRAVQDVSEKAVVHVSWQLRRPGIVGSIEAKQAE